MNVYAYVFELYWHAMVSLDWMSINKYINALDSFMFYVKNNGSDITFMVGFSLVFFLFFLG